MHILIVLGIILFLNGIKFENQVHITVQIIN